jgi:hypothetical protein
MGWELRRSAKQFIENLAVGNEVTIEGKDQNTTDPFQVGLMVLLEDPPDHEGHKEAVGLFLPNCLKEHTYCKAPFETGLDK